MDRAVEEGLESLVFRSIEDIDPAEWDSFLDPDDLQASHRFVRTCQESGVEQADYRFLLVRRGGRPVALAAFSRIFVSLDLLAPRPIQRAIRAVRRWRPGFLRVPVLFGGLPVSFGQSCLRVAPGVDPAPVMALVARRLEEVAVELAAPIRCFKEFSPEELPYAGRLSDHGYFRAWSIPSCSIPIRWPTAHEYLADLRASYRRQVATDRRAAERAGLRLREIPPGDASPATLFRLYEDVWERAPNKLERLNLAFFERLLVNFARECRVLLADQDGRTAGMALLLDGPTLSTFLLVGIDSTLGFHSHLYPNLVRRVVELAIERRARLVSMGQTSYPMKGRLGAVTSPRFLYLRGRTPLGHRLFHLVSPALFPEIQVPARRVFRAAP